MALPHSKEVPNLEEKVSQLLGMVDIHIKCCNTILDHVQHYIKDKHFGMVKLMNTGIGHYLMTVSNSHFSESVSILTSLLHSKKNSEISFKHLEIQLSDDAVNKLNELRNEFDSLGFIRFRQNIGDHKNNKIILNPIYLSLQFPSKNYVETLNDIFTRLNQLAHSSLDLTWFTTVSVTVRGLEEILNQVDLFFESNPFD